MKFINYQQTILILYKMNPFEILPDDAIYSILLEVYPNDIYLTCQLSKRFNKICSQQHFRNIYSKKWNLYYRRKYSGKPEYGLRFALSLNDSNLIEYFRQLMINDKMAEGYSLPKYNYIQPFIGIIENKKYSELAINFKPNDPELTSNLKAQEPKNRVANIIEDFLKDLNLDNNEYKFLGLVIGSYIDGILLFNNLLLHMKNTTLTAKIFYTNVILGYTNRGSMEHIKKLYKSEASIYVELDYIKSTYYHHLGNLYLNFYKMFGIEKAIQNFATFYEEFTSYFDLAIFPIDVCLSLMKGAILSNDINFIRATLEYLISATNKKSIKELFTFPSNTSAGYNSHLLQPAGQTGNEEIIDYILSWRDELFIDEEDREIMCLLDGLLEYGHINLVLKYMGRDFYDFRNKNPDEGRDFYDFRNKIADEGGESYGLEKWTKWIHRGRLSSLDYIEKIIFPNIDNKYSPNLEEQDRFGNPKTLDFLMKLFNMEKDHSFYNKLLNLSFDRRFIELFEYLINEAIHNRIVIDWTSIGRYSSTNSKYWDQILKRQKLRYYKELTLHANQILIDAVQNRIFDDINVAKHFGATIWEDLLIDAANNRDWPMVSRLSNVFIVIL